MVVFTLDMPSCHQTNILFLLFARDIEYYIEYFLLQSKIPTLAPSHYISLHVTAQAAYYLFIIALRVLPN